MYLNLRLFLIFLIAALSSAVVACSGPEPTPTSVPVAVEPTQVAVVPTAAEPTAVPATNVPAAAVESPTVVPSTTAPTAVSATPVPPTDVPPTAAPAAEIPVNFFGASTNGEVVYNEQLRALATLAGVQLVRTSVSWRNVEPVKGTYDWSGPDGLFNTLSDHNFQPLVLIMNNAEWASNTPCGPVNDLEGFEAITYLVLPWLKNWYASTPLKSPVPLKVPLYL